MPAVARGVFVADRVKQANIACQFDERERCFGD